MRTPLALLTILLSCLGGITAVGEPASAPDDPLAAFNREFSEDERQHWSFQPIGRHSPPVTKDPGWCRTPLDAFILARLEKEGIAPAPEADRRVLMRRVYFDLIGLPPPPEEQARFLADDSPTAYERLVDDLLSRPQYGERWARHWLDVARYAETNGYERDGTKPHAWRYRDYVIDAFNQDKPYDRFVAEQIAGDELPGSGSAERIATTFLRLGTWDDEPAEPEVDRYEQLDDVLGTTCSAFLAMTVQCARCHSHKFEPITQVDYSRMLAVFEPLKRPQNGRTDLDRMVGTDAELASYQTAKVAVERRLEEASKKIESARATIRERMFREKKTSLPPEAVEAFCRDPSKRSEEQKKLVEKFAQQISKEMNEAAAPEEKAKLQRWSKEIETARGSMPSEPPRAYIWYEDAPNAPPTKVFVRGDPSRPAGEVGPGILGVLARGDYPPPAPREGSTGRRLWLARWLTQPDHPLTARVYVNRVWSLHFGEGIVATENDFGIMGDTPSHPELLDDLASWFVSAGWRTKELHRRIVLSSTYRMSSRWSEASAKVDPTERLLWRFRPRRLEAEAIRDSALAIAGRLNLEQKGPSIYPPVSRVVLEGQSVPGQGWGKSPPSQAARRSVYIFAKRAVRVPELDLLDLPDSTTSCEQRMVSTIAPQALTLMNGDFLNEQAENFAERLLREAGPEPRRQVERAFALVHGRPPSENEIGTSVAFLERQRRQIEFDRGAEGRDAANRALKALCLVLLNTNEFAYLE